jgi:hypothetical protein
VLWLGGSPVDFPASFRADVEAFVARDDLDEDEEEGDRPHSLPRDETAKLLQLWLDHYRCTQFAINCTSAS